MTPTEAMQSLRNDPHYFLKYYPINPAGFAGAHVPDGLTPQTFWIAKLGGGGGGMKPGHVGATRPVKYLPMLSVDISSFRISTAPTGEGPVQFTALSVPMVYYDSINVGALNAYLIDNSQDIMITGQLTNCCFCVRPYAGGLACTHVNPRGYAGLNGPAGMQTQLNAGGQFANYAGVLATYGRQNYPLASNVIGVRGPGGWELFSQHSGNMFKTITAAYKVYPGPLTLL